ncbi:MAG: hypothetical protein IKB16_13685 [Lentisphaeria bacterium]|nr:hypothetical protein [Lentisphaeria bacterium]
MDYYVRQKNGDYAKVSESELLGMAENGLILEETQVRKALMPTWSKASDIPILQVYFKEGGKAAANAAENDPDKQDEVTAFENSFIPVRAGMLLRLQTFVLDIVLLVVLFFVVAAAATGILCIIGSNINEGSVRVGSNYLNVTVRTDRAADKSGALVRERLRVRGQAEKRYQEELKAAKAKLKKARADYDAQIKKLRAEHATKAQYEQVKPVPKIEFPKPPPVKEKVFVWKEKRNPTITDDAFEGCYTGSLWYNTKAKQTYICITGRKNKAVWMSLPMVNSAVNFTVFCAIFLGALFLAGSLMLRSQTWGMWYFGIFLSDAKDPKKEVMELRAFFYLLISVLTFWLNPLLLLCKKPGIAELITGTRLISIVSQKR